MYGPTTPIFRVPPIFMSLLIFMSFCTYDIYKRAHSRFRSYFSHDHIYDLAYIYDKVSIYDYSLDLEIGHIFLFQPAIFMPIALFKIIFMFKTLWSIVFMFIRFILEHSINVKIKIYFTHTWVNAEVYQCTKVHLGGAERIIPSLFSWGF